MRKYFNEVKCNREARRLIPEVKYVEKAEKEDPKGVQKGVE
jgi:hypothetical protein